MSDAVPIQERAIEELGERFAGLRIPRPRAEAAMEKSLLSYGQISPVVCARIATAGASAYELVDGFKRLRASRRLKKPSLLARTLDLSARACKAAILQLNHASASLHAMEEALVLQSLHREDALTQEQIGVLVGRDKSWVSRRLLLVEELDEDVQQDIRLGLLSVVTGREVARLPRGNQKEAAAVILEHRLSTRETARLVAELLSRPRWDHAVILASPWEVLEPPLKSLDLKGALAGMDRSCRRVCEQVAGASAQELASLAKLVDTASASAEGAIRELQNARRAASGSQE
jgi:ParB/RepB/Spo0J family partition protein